MNNERKYPNRADKLTTIFTILMGVVAFHVALIVLTIVYIKGHSDIVMPVFFITLIGTFIPLFILVLYLTSNKKNLIKGRKAYEKEINVIKSHKGVKVVDNIEGIDHLFITPYGVYALKGVELQGKIYAMETEAHWNEPVPHSKEKKQIPNPIKEHHTSIDNLKKKYHLDIDIISVVVLVSNNHGHIIAKELYDPNELNKLINASNPVIYSDKEIESIYVKLTK